MRLTVVSNPATEKQHAHRHHLGGLDLVALGCYQQADHVVAGLASTQFEQVGEQRPQLDEVGLQFAGVAQRAHPAQRAADDPSVPRERLGVRVRDAEQVGDHRDRQRCGERGDQIERARGRGPVEQHRDGAFDPVVIRADRSGAEGG
jgi:hypothetical protein